MIKIKLISNSFIFYGKLDTSRANLSWQNKTQTLVTEEELNELILNLDIDKSAGTDVISLRVIKEAGISISHSLTELSNLLLSSCHVPSTWKTNIIPFHKKIVRMA